MALEHWEFRQNVRKNKGLLKSLASLLTNEIVKRSSAREPAHLDFRYILPLAQWMVEQAGYTIKPEGNNPSNVMGSGDLGTFHRAKNKEVRNGKREIVPADFANYSNMEVAEVPTSILE